MIISRIFGFRFTGATSANVKSGGNKKDLSDNNLHFHEYNMQNILNFTFQF